MRHVSRDRCSDEILKSIFLEHLPAACRAILAVSDTPDLTRLAAIADKIVEHDASLGHSVASVTEQDRDIAQSEILSKIDTLVSRVDALSVRNQNQHNNNNNRNRFRGNFRDRSGSRSQSRNREGPSRNAQSGAQNDAYCFYHNTFGSEARKCRQPCSFVGKKSEN